MKISFRILLINFIIVALVLVSITLAYFSMTREILTSQHTKTLLNSANDLIFSLHFAIQETDEEFMEIIGRGGRINLENSKVDFIFRTKGDSTIDRDYFFNRLSFFSDSLTLSLGKFIRNNPNLIIKKYQSGGYTYYYGIVLSKEFLSALSKKIRADVAVTLNDAPLEISNLADNENYLLSVVNAAKDLKLKNNFDITREELDRSDFYATRFSSRDLPLANPDLRFIVFSTLPEAAELRNSINKILVIICSSGIALSLILVLLFTEKIRKQITHLSRAAEITRSGDLRHRVEVLSKDELGMLGLAFNNMLDELERNERNKSEYTEFISLINQNPTLKEISEIALARIIKSTGFTVGKLSAAAPGHKIIPLACYGIEKDLSIGDEKTSRYDLYQRVIEKSEFIEFNFTGNSPVISSGLLSLEIRYLMLYPVIYNRNVIAVLELASIEKPKSGIKDYLDNIHNQLAVGLSNASAFKQLENLVTELKELNEEYHRQNEQITEQNKQITEQNRKLVELHGQLSEKASELELQKEKAVESTQLKSQFLANMSHELRTPLNSILGLTEIILNDSGLSLPNKEKLSIVLRNGQRLMNLINDILNYSKAEFGKLEVKQELFSLKALIDELEIQISPLCRAKNLNFVIQNELPSGLTVNNDRDKITQVLINLLGNAVKFTQKGTILLNASLKEGNILRFEVADTGIGMSSEDQKIIFEEFRQIDGTSTRKYSGTGLGLAISRKYAELLEGSLSCESELSKGSVFVFSLPVNVAESIIKTEAEAEPEIIAEKSPVLIIDHDAENQRVIAQYLRSKRFPVVTSPEANEQLKNIGRQKPTAVILNALMAEQQAWKLLIELKQDLETFSVPVIMTSRMEDLNIGYALPVLDYLTSELRSEQITEIVEKAGKMEGKLPGSVVVITEDERTFSLLRQQLELRAISAVQVRKASRVFKSVLRNRPGLIIADAFTDGKEGITIINELKEAPETKDFPAVLILPGLNDEKGLFRFSHGFEKAAIMNRHHPVDVLRIIRDRMSLEKGWPDEDVSSIWIESSDGEKPQAAENGTENNYSKYKVLIVDDDADTLFTVSEIVHNIGCETSLAKNGLECLAALEKFTPDLILLDIMMPLMDGFETIRRIRADKHYCDIPVFALTALAMLDEKDVVIKNGFNDFISKPVNSGVLSFKIEKVLFNKTSEIVK